MPLTWGSRRLRRPQAELEDVLKREWLFDACLSIPAEFTRLRHGCGEFLTRILVTAPRVTLPRFWTILSDLIGFDERDHLMYLYN